MCYFTEFRHPAFTQAIHTRPRSDHTKIIFPWDHNLQDYNFSEYNPSYPPHGNHISPQEIARTVDRLKTSPYWLPEMTRVNWLFRIASLIGCINCCIVLPILLYLVNSNSLNASPMTVILAFLTVFCCIWCLCTFLSYCASVEDFKGLQMRERAFQDLLNLENEMYYHPETSWRAGPFGSYLQYNLTGPFYEPGQRMYTGSVMYTGGPGGYPAQRPVPMSVIRY